MYVGDGSTINWVTYFIRLSRKIFKLISVRLISRLPIVGLGKGVGGGEMGEIGLDI